MYISDTVTSRHDIDNIMGHFNDVTLYITTSVSQSVSQSVRQSVSQSVSCSKYYFVSAPTINTTPTLVVPQIIDQRPQQKYENESIQVIKSISSIIKDVINQEKDTQGKSDFDNIVQKIKNQVPKDVKLSTPQIDNSELLAKITETVGNILTDEEIESIVLLRNNTTTTGTSPSQEEAVGLTSTPATVTTRVDEEEDESLSSPPATVSPSPLEDVTTTSLSESATEEVTEVETISTGEARPTGGDEQSTLGTTVTVSLAEVLVGNLSRVRPTTDRNKEINQSYEPTNKGRVTPVITRRFTIKYI